MQAVTVRVPATSANLGSAFDTAGIAFDLYNVFSFEKVFFPLFIVLHLTAVRAVSCASAFEF